MSAGKVYPVESDWSLASGVSLGPPGGTKQRHRRRCHFHIPLRMLLIAFSVSMVTLVVVACMLPTALLWWTSLTSLSNVAKDSTDQHLNTYRALVVNTVTNNLTELLTSPVEVAELLSQLIAPLPIMNHSAWELRNELHRIFIPLYAPKYWPYIWSMQIAWQDKWNCQHQFRRVFGTSQYGIWDPCNTTMMHYWYYNNSIPTNKLANQMNLVTLTGRAWWMRPHVPSLLKDDASWCPPFWSVTPGEGKLITVSYAFPESMYNRSSPTFPISMCAFKIQGLNNFLGSISHSKNGWILLVEGSNYNLVASTESSFIPLQNCSMPATASPNDTVRNVVNAWIEGGKPDQMTLEGDVLLDSVQVAVPGGGIDFRLFIVTPRNDFLGDINQANSNQMRRAKSTLAGVLSSEVIILLLALVASILISLLLSRPLRNIKEQLHHIGNMDLELVKNQSKYSLISEVSKLQIEAKRMNLALDSFSKYVPRKVVKDLLRRQLYAEVGVVKADATIFFLDIVEFTQLMDTRGAVVVIEILKTMFERFSLILTSNSGVIDKYIGDSIMAFWGCPDHVNDPIPKACNALAAIIEDLVVINKYLKEQFDLNMKIRIGMHHGEVHAGNVGSSERLNYTVLGNSVNLASRLEALNKEFGTTAIVTDSVRNESGPDFAWRCLGSVKIRGFAEPLRVHEYIGRVPDLSQNQKDMLAAYEELDNVLCHLKARDPLPNSLLAQYTKENPEDLAPQRCLALMLKQRLAEGSSQDL